MHAGDKRDQKGVWRKIAPCLYRYRDSGTYYAIVKRSGKMVRKSLETERLEVAKRKLRDYLNEVDRTGTDSYNARFGDLIDDFLAGRVGAEKTLRRYRDIADKVRKTWPGGVRQLVRNVDLNQCSRWLQQFNDHTATYNLARQWLGALFSFCMANSAISRLPFTKATLPPRKKSKPVRLSPVAKEFEAMVNDIRNQAFSPNAADTADLVDFMGHAGVGQAECAGLQRQHVSLSRDEITLFRAKTRTSYKIPIFPKVRPLLERLMKETEDAGPQGRVFKVVDPKRALEASCRRLGLPGYSPRALRRFFIITALEKGVPVKTIAAWQGHQDGGVLVLKTYSDVIERQTNKSAAQLLA